MTCHGASGEGQVGVGLERENLLGFRRFGGQMGQRETKLGKESRVLKLGFFWVSEILI